jgi:hypothetical protein
MTKHFMCTHTFHSEESKSAFDVSAQNMTGGQMFAMMKNNHAELMGHWRGDNEFFCCHWYADDEDAIIDTLDALGFGDLMMTLPNEMRMFIDTNSDLEKTYFEYLNAEPEAV